MAYYKYRSQVHQVRPLDAGTVSVDGEAQAVTLLPVAKHSWLLRQDTRQQPLYALQQGETWTLWYQGESYELTRQRKATAAETAEPSDRISAPLTGKVILVPAIVGQSVSKGATLLVLESMKMETALTAPMDATIKALHCTVGDQVGNGQLLIELEVPA